MSGAAAKAHPRVLVVAYDFPPHAAIGTMRTLRLVRYLAGEGWDVEVLTGDPKTYRAVTPVDRALLERVPASVKVVRGPAWRWLDGPQRTRTSTPHQGEPAPALETKDATKDATSARQSATAAASASAAPRPVGRGPIRRLRRVLDAARAIPDRESSWLPPAVIAGLRHCTRPDLVYSSAPPWSGQLVALALTRAWGCPWVADFRDPWSRAPWREDRPPFVSRAAAWLERRVVARADRIVFVTEGNRDDFAAHYGAEAARRFHVVANGCDVSEFEGLTPAPEAGRQVVLHAGSLYGGRRDPRPLFVALARAAGRQAIRPEQVCVRFLGVDGPAKVTALARECGVEHMVETAPRVGRRESLQQMVSAAVLLLIQPGHAVSVPGKLYEYFAAGRPVLAMTDSPELTSIVRASGVGVPAHPEDEAAVEAALLQCLDMARRGTAPAPRAMYDGAAQVRATADILIDVADAGRRVPAAATPLGRTER